MVETAEHTGQNVGYLRVSSVDQCPDRQEDGLKGVDLHQVFTDSCSGGTRDRPGLTACMTHLRAGDTLHVYSIDRLARDMQDLLSIVQELLERHIGLVFNKENLRFAIPEEDKPADMFQTLMLQLLGSVAQFERSMINERQREGIAAAKARGKRMGRPGLSPDTLERARQMKVRGIPVAKIAQALDCGESTLYRLLKKDAA
jgi:DNA invertase Pin-like site-specific DNA recombinase